MSDTYEICHECSSKMFRDTKPDTLTYKEQSVVIEQPGWYCGGCDEVVLTGKDAKATESAFLALKAKVEGLLAPEEVKEIREKLKLSQAKAGEILGGGPRAFYKYEHGLTLLSRAMNNQLILLAHNPDRINELVA
jgi:HTH-type transcriptional regulator/antitoxin MqsA